MKLKTQLNNLGDLLEKKFPKEIQLVRQFYFQKILKKEGDEDGQC